MRNTSVRPFHTSPFKSSLLCDLPRTTVCATKQKHTLAWRRREHESRRIKQGRKDAREAKNGLELLPGAMFDKKHKDTASFPSEIPAYVLRDLFFFSWLPPVGCGLPDDGQRACLPQKLGRVAILLPLSGTGSSYLA